MNDMKKSRNTRYLVSTAIATAGILAAGAANAVGAVPAIITGGLDDVSVTFTAIKTAVVGFVVVGLAIAFLRRGK